MRLTSNNCIYAPNCCQLSEPWIINILLTIDPVDNTGSTNNIDTAAITDTASTTATVATTVNSALRTPLQVILTLLLLLTLILLQLRTLHLLLKPPQLIKLLVGLLL